MEEILIPLKEIAKEATIPQLKYWAKLLGVLLIVRGRVAHVTGNDSQRLLRIAELVKEGKSPQDAAQIVGPISTALVHSPEENHFDAFDLKEKMENLERRNDGIEKALFAVVDEMRALRRENAVLKSYLMPPQEPIKQVIPWQPENSKDPLEGLSWFQKAYIQVVEPWRMRRYDS